MKNSNGSGSVYKLQGKRRKSWIATVTTGYSLDGKQLRKSIGTFSTKREGQAALAEFLNKHEKKSTVVAMETRIKFLEPLFKKEMVSLKLLELQSLFDNLSLSYNFKNSCKSILNMIFDFALKNDFVSSNKVRFIEIGKKEQVVERRIFTKSEMDLLWENINVSGACHILILIYTGMRVGELLNLKNRNIDLENKLIQIEISKTDSGKRIIPISSKIFPLITKNMKISQEFFLESPRNTQLGYPTFKKRFYKILDDLRIEKHTIHDCRHTFASLLNNAEANSTAITKLIGHSSFKTTEEIYTHKDADELRKAIELI